MRRPRVEILYIQGCPNYEEARVMVDRAAAGLRLQPTIELVEVGDDETAARLHFLGSPTIRVDGSDVEPGANARRDFAVSCRVYCGSAGVVRQPDEAWIRDAIARAVV